MHHKLTLDRRLARGLAFTCALALALTLLPGPILGPAVGSTLWAQTSTAEAIQELSYRMEEAGEDIPYALFVPSSYDARKPAPLVVLLHGLGSNPSQVIRYSGITDEAEERGYLVVAPYGYNSRGWYGSLGPGKEFTARFRRNQDQPDPGANDPENLGELSEKDVFNVLALTRQRFAVDPARIYLMGHSMGGGGTLYLAMKYPYLWAAIGPMAPAIFSEPGELEKVKDLPAIVVQGEEDRLVRAERTRLWVEKMKELEMEHVYIEIPGGNHFATITRNPEMIARVFDFFDEHRRESGTASR